MKSASSRFNPRSALAFVHDLCAIAAAWIFAFLLRFNFEVPSPWSQNMLHALLWVVPLQAAVGARLGLYRGFWRYASLTDFKRILLAVGCGAAIVVGVAALLLPSGNIPRAVLVIYPLILVCLMSGSRIAYRIFKEYRLYGHADLLGEPVLILGAGDQGVALARELRQNHAWHVIGFLTTENDKIGLEIDGIKVWGQIDQLPAVAQRLGARVVIMALPRAKAAVRRHILELAGAEGLQIMTVPAVDDLLSGKVTISTLRQVELEDLLGREEISLDSEGLHRLLTGRTIMITGAGGSIGSELCRQVASFAPGRLVVVEQSELALYTLEQELGRRFPLLEIAYLIGDVKAAGRMDGIFARHRPQVVFHAAAYKHVPLMELGNLSEVLTNNVSGTLNVARLSSRYQVEKFVLISTDKAVNPTSVMGASKRLAELACQCVQRDSRTSFVLVRFGNVLGSAGSVIPKFREQIAAGGPVTVTHPEITRFFMTIPEAAQLVLQAGLMGNGGQVFVLDMGDPVRIVDLAQDMIRLSGLGDTEIPIVYTGLRKGEKLYEELLADAENTLPTPHPKLRVARSQTALPADWEARLESWLQGLDRADEETIRRQLQDWIPEYRPAA